MPPLARWRRSPTKMPNLGCAPSSRLGEGCDAILAAGLAAFAGLSAAEYLGAKGIGCGMIPITPTAAFPSPFLPPKWVPRVLNRASHTFVNATLWRAFRAKVNEARAMFKLPPRRTVWTEHPMIYGVSPSLLPAPADWPANARLCGQWLALTPDWTPPPALMNFLSAFSPRETPRFTSALAA